MAEQKKHKHEHDVELVEIEPVKQIEVETKDLVVSSKLFIYLIIGLLAYLIFLVIPSIEEKFIQEDNNLRTVSKRHLYFILIILLICLIVPVSTIILSMNSLPSLLFSVNLHSI